ncbi:MAG: hypothetical protein IJH64_09455, partial [Oscillospiraceae bacterium]|nr:hypothetical protein [Oscillospiraceae bacterium]
KEKKGGMSFSSYCYALGEITAWRNIKRRFASKARFIPFQNMDYRIGHLYGWADGLSETVEDARPSIEQADLINVLYGLGDETDREIMRYMLCGHGIRDIERKIGMSHQAICKRLKQLGRRFIELEKRTLGLRQGFFFGTSKKMNLFQIDGCQSAGKLEVI